MNEHLLKDGGKCVLSTVLYKIVRSLLNQEISGSLLTISPKEAKSSIVRSTY